MDDPTAPFQRPVHLLPALGAVALLLNQLPLAVPLPSWLKRCVDPFVSQQQADAHLGRRFPPKAGQDAELHAQQCRHSRRIAGMVGCAAVNSAVHLGKAAWIYASSEGSVAEPSARGLSWLLMVFWVGLWKRPETPSLGLIMESCFLLASASIDLLSQLPQATAAVDAQWMLVLVDATLSTAFLTLLFAMPVAAGGYATQVTPEERERTKQTEITAPIEHESHAENYQNSPTSPEDYASFYSVITYRWMEPIQKLSLKRSLRPSDVWKLRTINDTGLLHANFSELKGSLLSRIVQLSAHDASLDAVWKIVGVTMSYASPALTKRILECIEASGGETADSQWTPKRQALVLAILALALNTLRFIAELINYHRARQVGLRIRTVLTVELFDKVLQRPKVYSTESNHKDRPTSSHSADVGMVVNMIATDINNLLRMGCDLHALYGSPIEIVIATLFLYHLLGPSALFGVSLLVIALPINYALGKRNARLQKRYSEARDARISLITELMTSIRYVKAQSMGDFWVARIEDARRLELRQLLYCRINNGLIFILWITTPLLVTLLSFGSFVLYFENTLTIPIAFTAFSLFSMLRGPLETLPNFLTAGFQAAVSVRRLSNFLREPEVQSFDAPGADSVAQVASAHFSWPGSSEDRFTLRIDSLEIPTGTLCLVEGGTASGKTAFLLSLLSEMHRSSGQLSRPTSVSYLSQTTWLEDGKSVRDNILFGSAFDAARYEQALSTCQLRPDLLQLDAGEETRVSTQTLSGGQRARLGLCRAMYARNELVLLDDPLSAVDAVVHAKLVQECLRGPLASGRTILIATHHAAALRNCADMTLFIADGKVQLVNKQTTTEEDVGADGSSSHTVTRDQQGHAQEVEVNPPKLTSRDATLLYDLERRRQGRASWSALRLFLQSSSIGIWSTYLAIYLLVRFGDAGESLLLRAWGENSSLHGTQRHTDEYFVWLYAALVVFSVLARSCQSILFISVALRGGRKLHADLLHACLAATPRWHDITPTGRIVNRFTSDTWIIDQELPTTVSNILRNTVTVLASVLLICAFVPTFLLPSFALVIVGPLWAAGFIASTRDMQRIESTMASPIYSRFEEVMRGIEVVRAFGQQKRFLNEMIQTTSAFMAQWWAICSIQVWLSVRIGILGGVSVFIVTMLSLLGAISVGSAGIAISTAAVIPQRLYAILADYQTITNNINSMERVQEYLDVPKEHSPLDAKLPDRNWPSNGRVVASNITARYAPSLPEVLKGISLQIEAGEKVGIVGRTGSGKSSLVGLFLKMITFDGQLSIDGVDIDSVPLNVLRRSLGVCPQNPVLFSGDVRSNLDPHRQSTDSEMLAMLNRLLPAGGLHLDDPVASGGGNLSAGQKQAISLARALLRRPRILLLDEATSDTDVDTDLAIQRALAQLPDCTVITVAHRLRTIMQYDRIFVMDNGSIIEQGSPREMMQRPDSRFGQLCNAAGEKEYQLLWSLACE